jgi:transcriptional regulator with XRE-family HTH domain
MSDLARKTGITRAALYRLLSADGSPELSTLTRVLRERWGYEYRSGLPRPDDPASAIDIRSRRQANGRLVETSDGTVTGRNWPDLLIALDTSYA